MAKNVYVTVMEPVGSVNGKVGNVVIDKSDLGLENVDNTPDSLKPVSSVQSLALNSKANLLHLHPISDIEDLQDSLNAKADITLLYDRPKVHTVTTYDGLNYLRSDTVKLGDIGYYAGQTGQDRIDEIEFSNVSSGGYCFVSYETYIVAFEVFGNTVQEMLDSALAVCSGIIAGGSDYLKAASIVNGKLRLTFKNALSFEAFNSLENASANFSQLQPLIYTYPAYLGTALSYNMSVGATAPYNVIWKSIDTSGADEYITGGKTFTNIVTITKAGDGYGNENSLALTSNVPSLLFNRGNSFANYQILIDSSNQLKIGDNNWEDKIYIVCNNELKTLTFPNGFAINGNIVADIHGGTKIGTATNQKLAFFNSTPIVKPSAYTQTYATANKTNPAMTAGTLSGITSSTYRTTLGEPGTTYSQVILQTNFRTLQDNYNLLKTDLENTKKLLNSLIDDLQALGLVG